VPGAALLITSRLFAIYELWQKAAQTGAELLWRVRQNARLEVDRRLAVGSYLNGLNHSLTVFAAGFSLLLISGAALRVRVGGGIRNDVASPIPSFVRLEVTERLRSATGQRSFVTVVRIVAVIDVTGEASGSMEPWARPDE